MSYQKLQSNNGTTVSSTSIALVFAVVVTSACAAVPPKQNMGELIASEGVREMFEKDPTLAVLHADGTRVKCRQIKRVGTHIHSRMCMTVDEWASRERALDKTKTDLMAGVCTKSGRIPGRILNEAYCSRF